MTTSRETTTSFVERFIGNGAMGQVYELMGHKPLVILDPFTAVLNNYPAVIKYMLCGNEAQLEIFKNECEALKKIYHVNVVRLYRYIEEGIKVGIVMEYCQKGPLKGVILDPTITYSMNTVLTWGVQLFDAIHHMYHKHRLVHRDIKPDNIFVTDKYQLKIGDFGLVKVVGDGTVTGTFIGTQRYMSPPDMKEDGVRNAYKRVMEADPSNSHRNDVYSLGLVMWEIIERRTIFKNYEMLGHDQIIFDRDRLLIDIALKRVTEIESPECQSEIQKTILRCTNFQRIHRPTASQVLDFLKQTQKADEFISSLPFTPTKDENQKELMKPIGFDDRTEWVMVESEEKKYEKRFEEHHFSTIGHAMLHKLGTLNSAEREEFYKEAPNIVSRLKEETQTFKDARYVIYEIFERESGKANLYQKDLYEIFELFVLGDFGKQRQKQDWIFAQLKSHEVIWKSSFANRWTCESCINDLKVMKREKYTTNFYFRYFISQSTGEGWFHIKWNWFVSEDLGLWKEIPGKWVDNPRAEIRSYEIKNEANKHEMLHFSHYKQIPLEQLVEAFKKQQTRMETIIKLHLKYLIPIEDSEKNNVPFNIVSILHETPESRGSYWRNYEPYPFPHYLFQLRNPPRPICQNNHSGKCQMDGFRKLVRFCQSTNSTRGPDSPKELHIPVCGEIRKNEVLFLESYMNCIRPDRALTFMLMEHQFLFLCCQNLLDIPFLILLDHPNNYENGESIPGLDFNEKFHNIDVGVLREHFQELKFNERVYALIKSDIPGSIYPYIRLIDYQGNPKTEWLRLKTVPNSASYSIFITKTGPESVFEVKEVTKKERQ